MVSRGIAAFAVAAAVCALGGASAVHAEPARELLPDLDQEYPSDLRVTVVGSKVKPLYLLGFTSAVRNIGDGPLIIRGHRPDAGTAVMQADQVVERADGTEEVSPGIGSMQYVVSPDHQHWHYLGFDRYQIYELRKARLGTEVARDQKTGFCLGDRYRVTIAVRHRAPSKVYTSRCGLHNPGLASIEEGISVGYGDAYSAFLEGQDLPLSGLAAGRYVLVH